MQLAWPTHATGWLLQVMYLEQYVEGTYFLPTELQRVLHLVKSIDDRSAELSDSLQATTQQLLGLPPQYHQAHGPSEHYTQLMQKLEAGQKQLTQFAEERTHLAQQAYDLIEMHALDLERTMENFEADLRAGGVMDADLGLDQSIGYHEVYSPSSLTQLEAQLKQRTPPPDDILGLPTPGVAITPLPLALTPAPTATTKPYVTDGIPGKSSGVGLGTPQTAVAATLGSPPPAPPSGSVTSPPTTVTTLTIKRTASASSGGHKISLPLPLKKARAEDASTPGGGPPSASTPTPPAVSVPGHQSTIMGTSTPLPAMAAPPPPPVLAPPPPPPLHVAPPPPIPASSAGWWTAAHSASHNAPHALCLALTHVFMSCDVCACRKGQQKRQKIVGRGCAHTSSASLQHGGSHRLHRGVAWSVVWCDVV